MSGFRRYAVGAQVADGAAVASDADVGSEAVVLGVDAGGAGGVVDDGAAYAADVVGQVLHRAVGGALDVGPADEVDAGLDAHEPAGASDVPAAAGESPVACAGVRDGRAGLSNPARLGLRPGPG